MAEDKQDKQDFKLELAHKVSRVQGGPAGRAQAGHRPHGSFAPQVFLFKSGGVEGIDKQKLKAEIVAAVIKDGGPRGASC
jgi:hypothetical protein